MENIDTKNTDNVKTENVDTGDTVTDNVDAGDNQEKLENNNEEGNISTLDMVESLRDTIKQDFIKTLVQMVNEFDLVFDYIDKDVIKKLRHYIKKLNNNQEFYQNETKCFIEKTSGHYDMMYKITIGNQKLKTHLFNFMNELVLFNDILDFSVFKEENKNTKKTLVNYLYSMYMSSNLVNLDFNNVDSVDTLTTQLKTFIDELQANQAKETNGEESQNKNTKQRRVPQGIPGIPDMSNLFGDILGNKEIMNIATDMAKDLQTQNINPMSLISSLMTGKTDGRLNSIVNRITNQLEEKVNSGELNKDMLEQQANNILKVVENNDITSQLPMLKTLLNNKNLNNKFK